MLGVKGLRDREQMSCADRDEKNRTVYEAVLLKHDLNKSLRFSHQNSFLLRNGRNCSQDKPEFVRFWRYNSDIALSGWDEKKQFFVNKLRNITEMCDH